MKLGIIGSRKVTSNDVVTITLQDVIRPLTDDCIPITFLGGWTKGAERIAKQWATDEGWDYVLFKPYNFLDKSVPADPRYFYYRSKEIVDNSDAVVVFFEESENGVKRTIDYLKERTGKPYKIFDANGIMLESRGDFTVGYTPWSNVPASNADGSST